LILLDGMLLRFLFLLGDGLLWDWHGSSSPELLYKGWMVYLRLWLQFLLYRRLLVLLPALLACKNKAVQDFLFLIGISWLEEVLEEGNIITVENSVTPGSGAALDECWLPLVLRRHDRRLRLLLIRALAFGIILEAKAATSSTVL
jgi:hypothetical protein